MLTCRDLTAVWLGLMLPAMVICAGAPEIAPAAQLPDVFDAPETVDRESDTYTLKAYVWRDSQPLVITGKQQAYTWRHTCLCLYKLFSRHAGDQPLSSSQTRLADNSSPLMATLYLNDQACNRETEPVIKCQTAYLLQEHGKQFEVCSVWL